MGLPVVLALGGTVVALPSAVVCGAGSGGAIVGGGGGGGWLRAVLCPPQAESTNADADRTIKSRTRVFSASAACRPPSFRRPGSASRWQCAAPCWSGRGSQAPLRRCCRRAVPGFGPRCALWYRPARRPTSRLPSRKDGERSCSVFSQRATL